MYKVKKSNKYFILLFLMIFCIFQYGVMKICGFTMYPDEFGYWASAAKLTGYDWSEIASMGSYYSFGYSLILFPILTVFKNGVLAYRMAILVNMLLMCISLLLFQKVIGILYPEIDQSKKSFISGIGVFYPVWIFYSQMTMAEGLLFFLFVLVVYLLLRFLEKQSIKAGILTAITFVYLYCVHMRTIGILIAGVMTLLFWLLVGKGRKRYLIVLLAALLIAGSAALYLKERTVYHVFSYVDGGVPVGNDYSGQWGKLEMLFNIRGIRDLLSGIIGKLFYLGISSFGTFYWAIVWCVKEIASGIKQMKRDREKPLQVSVQSWMALFLLLAVIGEILISCIFLNRSNKIDCLVYGRYNDFLVPVIMVVGLIAMMDSRFLLSGTISFGAVTGCMMMHLLDVVDKWKLKGFRGYHAAGISYLLEEKLMEEGNFDMLFFFRDTWILGFGCMLLMAVLVWAARRKKNAAWILLGILVMEIALGIHISEHYTYSVNRANYGNMVIADTLSENYVEGDKIVYLNEGQPQFIDFIQMQLPNQSIHVIEPSDFYGMNDDVLGFQTGMTRRSLTGEAAELPKFLITHRETKLNAILQELYGKRVSANTFYLYIREER